MTPKQAGDLPRVVLFGVFSFVLALAAYAPAFEGPLVWDDETLILRKEIAQLQPLHVYLSRPFWLSAEWEGGAAYYRPLSILSLALDNALHYGNPAGFHLTNLLLHGVCTVLVFALGRRLGAPPVGALIGSLLFAWFPRLSEDAAWVSGRTDVLGTLFSLAALLVTLGRARARTWLAALLALCGLLSKEVALAAALAIAFHELWHSRSEPMKRRLLALLPISLGGLTYLVLRGRVLGLSMRPGDAAPGARFLTALEALGRYATMVVDGWHPRLNIGFVGQTSAGFSALGAVVLLALIVLAIRVKPGSRELLLLTAAAIAIGLVLHILPFHSTTVVADRFLYLPMAAFVPTLVARVSQLSPARNARRWLGVLAVLALSYLPVTWQRARVWGDAIEFWGTAVREQALELNALSHLGLGSLLAGYGMYDEAMAAYGRAQPGDGRNFLLARHNQAQLLSMNGETEQALAVLEEAARVHPMPAFYPTIAMLHTIQGRDREAQAAIATYGQLVDDNERVAKLSEQVATASRARPRDLPGSASLDERIERAQSLSKRLLFRVAMTELTKLIDDPAMTSESLRGILVFALGYGTPAQVDAIYRQLLALDPATPEEFSLLVSERAQKVRRLRRLCKDLGIEVRS